MKCFSRTYQSISGKYLVKIRIPTLNKDFIVDEKQVIRARNGRGNRDLVDCCSLIRGSSEGALWVCDPSWLEVLVETHHLAELEVAHRIGAQIIGVNNRNLVTLRQISILALNWRQALNKNGFTSLSLLFSQQTRACWLPYFNGILVGTALMKADNVAEKVKELQIDKG